MNICYFFAKLFNPYLRHQKFVDLLKENSYPIHKYLGENKKSLKFEGEIYPLAANYSSGKEVEKLSNMCSRNKRS